MRLSRLGLVLVWLGSAKGAFAQVPIAPAVEPAPAKPAPAPAAPAKPAPAAPPTDAHAATVPAGSAPDAPPASEPAPEPAAPEPAVPEPAAPSAPTAPPAEPVAPPPVALPLDAAGTVAPATSVATEPVWTRAHTPLTLEGRLGFLVRPDSSAGFDHESNVGAEVGLSLYVDLKRELAAGLEIERASLGRGTAISGLDAVSVDYSVSSAMLGLRAYPKRTELIDLFVGLQVGVGIQGVSAGGTANNGPLGSASPYTCGASDGPAFQIGGGVGARLMLSPRWGVTARINGTGRRLSGDMVEDCARGLGSATTVSAGLGLGYDFDLEP